jgi:hypothetical protein
MSSNVEYISNLVLDYLKKRPESGDTLRGIAEMWLEYAKVEAAVRDISLVLDSLVEQGRLRVIQNTSGINIYKLNE